jgi:hypothetical protein
MHSSTSAAVIDIESWSDCHLATSVRRPSACPCSAVTGRIPLYGRSRCAKTLRPRQMVSSVPILVSPSVLYLLLSTNVPRYTYEERALHTSPSASSTVTASTTGPHVRMYCGYRPPSDIDVLDVLKVCESGRFEGGVRPRRRTRSDDTDSHPCIGLLLLGN